MINFVIEGAERVPMVEHTRVSLTIRELLEIEVPHKYKTDTMTCSDAKSDHLTKIFYDSMYWENREAKVKLIYHHIHNMMEGTILWKASRNLSIVV